MHSEGVQPMCLHIVSKTREYLLIYRHDIIHLLTELPPLSNMARSPSPTHSSSSSWDSLPSDTDETFHITSAEQLDEYERKKKQQWINALREDRLREREEQDRAQAVEDGRALSHTDWDPKEQVSYLQRILGLADK